MGEFERDIMAKISRLEEKTKSNSKRITNIEEKIESLPRLETLMQMVIETNNKQSETLDKINENLTGLNSEMKSMSNKVNTLDDRVDVLEKDKENRRIDTLEIVKKVFVGIILVVIGGILGIKL